LDAIFHDRMSNQTAIKADTPSGVNPLFMSSSDLKGSDIDFGLISEYLSSEKKSGRDRELGLDDISAHELEENSAHGLTATDISDEEGMLNFFLLPFELLCTLSGIPATDVFQQMSVQVMKWMEMEKDASKMTIRNQKTKLTGEGTCIVCPCLI
jgi:hypothetical protein